MIFSLMSRQFAELSDRKLQALFAVCELTPPLSCESKMAG